MKVDDDMLLVIFDAPTESPVLETFESHRSHPTRRQVVYTVDKLRLMTRHCLRGKDEDFD